MKIAIVAPSPIPFTIGGAENLVWGLCEQINRLSGHQAELIKIPIRELSFWDLIDSYYKFYSLDLSHFDLVITSKYPAWMLRHENSICYMMHTLRGLYDTYHLTGLPEEVERGPQAVNEVLDHMEYNPHPLTLDFFFALLFRMRGDRSIPGSYFDFPGPLIRKIIHYLDTWGLSQRGVKRYCAISDTVKNRKDYFPEGASVKTVYPPTTLKTGSCGEYKYIFMISRLDAPKRIDMLIRAMRHVKSDVELLIAGTGPERRRLEELAKGDSRIRFLGFVRDEEAEQYYANCLVVPYFPYDEDYGYITIEAMLHQKPVITTSDAGGPTEFVIDGESGYVTAFDERAIAEKIDDYAQHPEMARLHGKNGYERVRRITWENAVSELLEEKRGALPAQGAGRKKIVVTSTFSVYPPQGGGQARIFNLYKNLAKKYDVEIVSFGSVDKKKACTEIASGLFENRVPKSEKHQEEESRIEAKVRIPVTDIAMLSLSGKTPEYGIELKRAIDACDLVIVSHPYLYHEVKKYLGDRKFIYEAQDIEYEIKKEMLPKNACAGKLLEQLFEAERECCEKSEFIMTCSEEDKRHLGKLYGVSPEKMIVVPNGVDCSQTEFVSVPQRLENKRRLGLAGEKIGLFMGSWHRPNLEACEEIIRIAEKCPDVRFMLMGSQCMYFQKRKLPDNVGLLGVVSEEQKKRIFAIADFALNPMMSGSGTNLKMFDYMSAGLPVLTTEFGARGIERKDLFLVAEPADMPERIETFELGDCASRTEEARRYAEETFDWSVIAELLDERLARLTDAVKA